MEFLHHYKVEKFELKENQMIESWILNEGNNRRFKAFYKMIQDYYLVWVLDEPFN